MVARRSAERSDKTLAKKEKATCRKADIGVVGLAVMGENLILNMESKGFTVACYNRTVSKVDDFINGRAKGKNIIGAHSVEDFCAQLKRPRKVMLMVKAGERGRRLHRAGPARTSKTGDIIIDGGNSPLPGHHPPHRSTWRARACSTSAPASPAARKAPCSGPRIMPGGSPDGLAAREADLPDDLPPRPTTASPAATGSARTAPATS